MGEVLRVVGSVAGRGGAVGSFWAEHRGILSDMGGGGLADVTEESIAAEGSVEKAPTGDEERTVDGFVGKAEPRFNKTGTQGRGLSSCRVPISWARAGGDLKAEPGRWDVEGDGSSSPVGSRTAPLFLQPVDAEDIETTITRSSHRFRGVHAPELGPCSSIDAIATDPAACVGVALEDVLVDAELAGILDSEGEEGCCVSLVEANTPCSWVQLQLVPNAVQPRLHKVDAVFWRGAFLDLVVVPILAEPRPLRFEAGGHQGRAGDRVRRWSAGETMEATTGPQLPEEDGGWLVLVHRVRALEQGIVPRLVDSAPQWHRGDGKANVAGPNRGETEQDGIKVGRFGRGELGSLEVGCADIT